MRLKEIVEVLEAELLVGNDSDLNIYAACGSDLMSDVMAFVKENVALLTGLVNPQVVRTAEMMDIRLVIFVRGKTPTNEIIDLAKSKGIAVITTKLPMFIACGKLYEAGVTGRGACE